jgi:serine/threonine-protein kinase
LEKLGKYLIIAELGRGAGGVVYRARDPIINRHVALKTITTGLAEFPDLLQRFYQEAQSAGGLQHPNIVTIYDMGDENGIPYIAMELVDGETLDQVISRRPDLSIPLKLTYAMQACHAFDYAHKRGIIHRDIKPDNVMLGKDGTVKVVDFGIARVLETSRTQTGMLLGTFAYMSPEQYHGEHADARSDIWSFGILLYEFLAYQRPFRGQTPAALMHSICQLEPTPVSEVVPDCPPGLENIMKRLLAKAPADRYQSMEEVLLDLDPICKSLQAESVAGLVAEGRQLAEQGDYRRSRDYLRQALQLDSTNTQARNLLDKVNVELRRILVRPKVQQHIDKGQALFAEGKLHEALAETECALQLDSVFEPAQELRRQIEKEMERARQVAEWLEAARQRLAEGVPEEAEKLLAEVLGLEPSNAQALALGQQVIQAKEERQKRTRLFEQLQAARTLWTQQNYSECIQLLTGLGVEFPHEDEIPRLLETAREDQAHQIRAQGLAEARRLLANRLYDECKALLADLHKQFPEDEEIQKLEERRLKDHAKQRKLQSLAEARTMLAARRFDDCLTLLGSLEKEFPDEEEISRLRERVLEDQTKQRKLRALDEVRGLLGAGRFEDCLSLLAALQKEFPADPEVAQLQKTVLDDQAKQRMLQALGEARSHLASRRFDEAISLLTSLQKEFRENNEVPKLLLAAKEEKAEQARQLGVASVRKLLAAGKYDQCKATLADLQKEFPKDDEISRLAAAVVREEAEQQKLQGFEEARNLLAARRHADSAAVLLKLQKQFPRDNDISRLIEDVRRDEAEQRKLQGLTEARTMLGARRYEETIALLVKMLEQYPGDGEISRLVEAAKEQQTEQRKLKGLADARNLISARNYDESISLLFELQKSFPGDEEVVRLLESAREDHAEAEKQKTLAEARVHLAARRFREAVDLLESARKAQPRDSGIQKLLALAKQDQEEQAAQERLARKLAEVRKLVNERKFAELAADAHKIRAEFPDDSDLTRLVEFAQEQHAQIERDREVKRALDEVKRLFAANRFEDALQAAATALKKFPGLQELVVLKERAGAEQLKLEKRQHIEQRIREIKVRINRGRISEAIDLANETLVTMGPDTDVTQLLNSARVEYEAREKKIGQERKLEEIRTLIAAGNLMEGSKVLDAAVENKTLELFDPRVRRISEEIEVAKAAAVSETQLPTVSLSREYAWLEAPPVPERVVPGEPKTPTEVPEAKASAAPAAQPVAPVPAPRIEEARQGPAATAREAIVAIPGQGTRSSTAAAKIAPSESVRAVPEARPEGAVGVSLLKRPAGLAAIALVAIALVWAGLRLLPTSGSKGTSATNAPKDAPVIPKSDPLELQQRAALDAADKLVAANNLEGALKTLDQAATLPGPLGSEIQAKRTGINEALQNAGLRALRQKEEQLWQEAKGDVAAARFREGEKRLQQILALGEGGLRKNEARQYLATTLPAREQEEKLFSQARRVSTKEDLNSLQDAAALLGKVVALGGPRAQEAEQLQSAVRAKMTGVLTSQAHQDLQRGDLHAARLKAAQIQQSGGDARQLTGEIDQAEQNRFTQLAGQFNQLKQADDDASAQQLAGLQREFQRMAEDSGPRADDARNIANSIPSVVRDIHDRSANKRAEAAYQQLLTRYQQALAAHDKGGLEAARTAFQPIVQSGGAHAADAQKRLDEINNELAALNQPPPQPPAPPPVKPEAPASAARDAILALVREYEQAYNQRSADALQQIWPSIGSRYAGLKSSFEKASSIRMRVQTESVTVLPDGATAIVTGQFAEEYTPRGQKAMNVKGKAVFKFAKSNGTWIISDVQ